MPRATASKATSTTTSKPTKSTSKSTKTPKNDPLPTPALSEDNSDPHTTASIPKELLIQVILAKLEGSKTCDWFELSKMVNEKLGTGSKEALGIGKKSKKGKEEGWTGTDLSELYTSTILPGLKSGTVVWYDGPVPTSARTHTRGRASTSSEDTKIGTPVPTKPTKTTKKRRLTVATSDDTPVAPRAKGGKVKDDTTEDTPPPLKKRRTTSASSTKATRAKKATTAKAKTKDTPTKPDSPGRAVRASRKVISYREDLVANDNAEVDMLDDKDMVEDESDEEHDEEDGDNEEEDGDSEAVQEGQDEGQEDEVDEDGVEDGAED